MLSAIDADKVPFNCSPVLGVKSWCSESRTFIMFVDFPVIESCAAFALKFINKVG